MAETGIRMTRTILLVVLIWITSIKTSFAVEPSWVGKRKFDGEPTGIIRDIVSEKNTLFLGAENGLFRVVGESSKRYSSSNSPLGKGYITDLYLDGDTLYIAEYGNGLFAYSLKNGKFREINLPQKYAPNVWAVYPIAQGLVVSTISQILIIPSSKHSQIIIKDKIKGGNKLSGMYSLSALKETIIIAESNHLLFLSGSGKELKVLDRESTFPKLSKITYVETIGEDIYVGGVGGVYKLEENITSFYPIIAKAEQLRDVESILVDSVGQFWVAAGGLYRLDEAENKLKELKLGAPRYQYDQIRAVQSIHQTSNQEILISSTQLGLIELNRASFSIAYPHETTFPYRKDIYSLSPIGQQKYLAQVADGWLLMDAETGKLSALSGGGFDNEPIVLYDNQLLSPETCQQYRYENKQLITTSVIKDSSGYCQHLKALSYIQDSIQYFYYETASHAGFVTIKNGAIAHDANSPKAARFVIGGQGKPVLMMDQSNTVFIQESPGVWIKQKIDGLKGVYIYCLYSDETGQFLYMCTSGRGLKRYNINSGELQDAFPSLDVPRFIRDGFVDTRGNHWLATNKGFVVANANYLFEFEQSDGIVDTDFNYGGILPISDSSFLMVGDQLSYIIDTRKLSEYVISRRDHQSSANILASTVRFGHEQLTDISVMPGRTVMSQQPEEILLEFASSDFAYSHLHQLEYRMKGLHNEWHQLPTNIGSVAYSGLGAGDFDFQVRVVDEKSSASQPVTQFSFFIPTPWWQATPAYIAYLCLFILLCWSLYRLNKRHLAAKSRFLAGMIRQKQSALIESNRSITEMLEKKERMFSNLAQELRTPLMMIVWPIVELRSQNLTATVREQLDVVFNNANRLRSIVEQLLIVEKIEHINHQSEYAYEVGETISFIIDAHRPAALSKQQVLSVNCNIKQKVNLIVDSLELMLDPLLTNALAYSQNGAHIKIDARIDESRLLISVCDNGSGMTIDEVDFLLGRFKQAANFKGKPDVGIGLNLANELAVANEGWLEILSQEGVGTTVTIHLPIRLNSPDSNSANDIIDVNKEELENVAEVKANYTTDLPVVLIVDNSVNNCEYLVGALSEHFNCYHTLNGQSALELISVLKPDVIISELKLPGMSGIALTEHIRNKADFSDLPVILLTAQTDQKARIDAFKATVNDYLIKPVERQELVLRIESQLKLVKLAHTQLNKGKGEEEKSDYLKAILPQCKTEKERVFILKLLNVVEKRYPDETFSRSGAASEMAMSERQLNRMMAKLMPDNFTLFLKKYRLEKSLPMLERGLQITQIALEVGFGSSTYYSRCFKQEYGCLPTQMSFEQESANLD